MITLQALLPFASILECDESCGKFYFSNVNGLSGYVSLLTNDTLAVMFWNWQRFWRHTSMFCSQESVPNNERHDPPNNVLARFVMETKKFKINKFRMRYSAVWESHEIKILNAPLKTKERAFAEFPGGRNISSSIFLVSLWFHVFFFLVVAESRFSSW